MANINDARNLAREIVAEHARLRAANISPDDYAAISMFANYRQGRVSRNTLRQDMGNVRRAALAASGDLLDCDRRSDVDEIMSELESQGVESAESKNAYLRALRQFFKHLDTEPDYPDYDWIEDVENYERENNRRLKAEDYLTEAEVTELREAATDDREVALVEFLADTGARINLVCNLRRKDVDLGTNPPTFRPNPNARDGYKGVEIKRYPIHYCENDLRRWVNKRHPDDHPDAPLFPVKIGYDKGDRENMAMHPQTAFGAIKRLAEETEIDKDRVNAHAFRHAAVRRMKTDPNFDFDWETVKLRTAWSDQAFESMKELYGALEEEEQLDYFAGRAGRETDDSGASEQPSVFTDCPSCGEQNRREARYCDRCGKSLEGDIDTVQEQLVAALGHAEGDEALRVLQAALGKVMGPHDGDGDE